MSAPALPPIAYQIGVISTGLNATLFFTFLMGMCSSTSHLHNLIVLGIYTTAYFGTVYFYGKCAYNYESEFCNDLIIIVTRKTSQTRVVTATITMLYLINTGQLAIQWLLLKITFVDSGETRKTIFIATFFSPDWVALATTISIATTNVLADGLLVSTIFTIHFRFSHLKLGKIWRCFYVWNRSLLAISLPFFFLVVETGEISFERTRRPN